MKTLLMSCHSVSFKSRWEISLLGNLGGGIGWEKLSNQYVLFPAICPARECIHGYSCKCSSICLLSDGWRKMQFPRTPRYDLFAPPCLLLFFCTAPDSANSFLLSAHSSFRQKNPPRSVNFLFSAPARCSRRTSHIERPNKIKFVHPAYTAPPSSNLASLFPPNISSPPGGNVVSASISGFGADGAGRGGGGKRTIRGGGRETTRGNFSPEIFLHFRH